MNNRRGRLLLALLAFGALVSLAGCADFPPSPTVCLTCEEGIENATEDGPNVSVESSELEIQVREEGVSRWTVRANLSGPEVGELRSDPGQVSRLAGESVTGSVGTVAPSVAIHGEDVTNVSGRMEGNTLVIAFTVTDVAKRGFGNVLLVDYFNTEGEGPPSYLLGTDRVVVRGPPETVVTNHPPEANVTEQGQTVVWRSSNTAAITGETHVAFAPDDRSSSRLWTRATVTADVASWAVPETVRVGVPYALAILGVAALFSTYLAGRLPIRRVGQGDSFRARFADKPPVGLLIVMLLYVGLIIGYFAGIGRTLIVGLFVWPPLVPGGLFLLTGAAVEQYPRVCRSLTLALGGVPFVMASTHVLALPPSYGLSSTPSLDMLVPIVALLLVGGPLFYLGTRFRRRV